MQSEDNSGIINQGGEENGRIYNQGTVGGSGKEEIYPGRKNSMGKSNKTIDGYVAGRKGEILSGGTGEAPRRIRINHTENSSVTFTEGRADNTEGYDKDRARVYGLLVGASEASLEYLLGGITDLGGISAEKLLAKASNIDKLLVKIAANSAISIGSEITEEELQLVLEPAIKKIVLGADYDLPKMEEILETAIVTAISTGVLGGGSNVISPIAESSYAKSKYGDNIQGLINEGLALPNDTVGFKLATKYQEYFNNKKTLSGTQLHNLSQAIEKESMQTARNEGIKKEQISLEEFANRDSEIWRNVDYSDNETKAEIMNGTHNRMVAEGNVVKVSDETQKKVEESYPDLRSIKKKERTPILKAAMDTLKNNLRQFLNGFKSQNFEFEVNGKVLEAKLYNTGINEVLEKITQEKANMLYSTEGIFKNAQYLYSTADYDGDPNVYRWNYFYTPVQIGEETVGVRIAVRDMATPKESQIYNWNIKKDTSLDDAGRGKNNRISHGVSSDVSNNTVPQNDAGVNNNISDVEQKNTQADPNGPANFMPETDNTESGDVGFSSPSDQEIYRESTDKEKYDAMFGKRKDAKQRHILDVAKKLDSGLKVVFVDPDNKMLSGRAGVFMPDSKTIYLSNDNSVVGMYCQLFKHEFVHRLELKKAYQSFKNYLFRNSSVFERYVRARLKKINGTEFDGTREEALKALSSYYLNLVRNGDFPAQYKRSFTVEYAEREMVADFVGEVLFKGKKNYDDIAQNLADSELGEVLKLEDTFAEFENLNETERGWFRRMIDTIKDFISSLKGVKQNKRLVEDLEYIEKRLARVLDSKDTKKAAKQNGGTVNYSIVNDSKNRKVVMLDRNIFDSIQDLEERAEKLEDWIINKFGGQKFNTSDYFFLIVNERTAGKMKFWNENMDEMLYKRKLSAAEHIDELIKLSKFDRYSRNVKDKHKEFAKMGWNYFKSYFTDGIRIYEADISVAKTKEQSVVYNIGYIKDVGKFLQKNKSPDSFTGSPNELVTILGNEASNWDSNNKIPHEEDSVKNNISEEDENYSDISDIKQQFSLTTPAQQQRENLDKYERGEITREEYLEETDRLWGEANETYGVIPEGEKANAPIATPQAVAEDKPTRRFARTIIETGALTDEMLVGMEEICIKLVNMLEIMHNLLYNKLNYI